jgi:hypothetical protein
MGDPADRRIKEGEVEGGVVADQDRALAFGGLDRIPYGIEDVVERLALGQGPAEGVVRVDARHLEGARVDIGARERIDIGRDGRRRHQEARGLHADGDDGDFQQGIPFGIEAARFDIHDDRQEPPEPPGHRRSGAVTRRIHRYEGYQSAPEAAPDVKPMCACRHLVTKKPWNRKTLHPSFAALARLEKFRTEIPQGGAQGSTHTFHT